MVDEFIRRVTSTSVLYSQRNNFRKVVNCGGAEIRSHILVYGLYMSVL